MTNKNEFYEWNAVTYDDIQGKYYRNKETDELWGLSSRWEANA